MNQKAAKQLMKKTKKQAHNTAATLPKGLIGATVSVWTSELATAGDLSSNGDYRLVVDKERILLKQTKPASVDYVMELQDEIASLMYRQYVEYDEAGKQSNAVHIEIHQTRIENRVFNLDDDENAEITFNRA